MSELAGMMMKRAESKSELSVTEFTAVKEMIRECCFGYSIYETKKKIAKVELGVEMDAPTNPVTAYVYVMEMGAELSAIAEERGWCKQFAGKGQWSQIGRKIKAKQSPIYSYKFYGKDVVMYAFEQTEAL